MNIVDALLQTILDLQTVRAQLLAENDKLREHVYGRKDTTDSTAATEVTAKDDTASR